MKALKIAVIVFLVYVGIVVAFETTIGWLQPQNESTLVLTTTDSEGATKDRVLARIESNGQLYVAANHWPRAWYDQVLAHPIVRVTIDGEPRDYMAVPVRGAEHERVEAARPLGLGMRVLTGFPPRRFLRLEPAGA